MKKLLFLSLVAVMVAGCTGKQDKGSEDISKFRAVKLDGSYELQLPDSMRWDEGKFYSKVDVYVSWPEVISGAEPKALQDSILSKAFGDYKKGTMDSTIVNLQTVPTFYETGDGVSQSVVEAIPAGADMHTNTYMVEAYPCRMSERIYTYYIGVSVFPAGAAHPMSTETYVNYDVEKGEVITLGSIFKDVKALKAVLIREIKANADYNDMVLTDEVPAPDNFRFNGYLIRFVFNPYEVAAYAAGVVTVDLPAYELADYMTDYGRQLCGVE